MSTKGGRNSSWSRLKPANQDIFEEMGLRSKGDKQLLDYKTQERFYNKIVERYMLFAADARRGDELNRKLARLNISQENGNRDPAQPVPNPADLTNSKADTNELDAITMGMRKLREGIVASKRIDDFSIQAYIFCIRLSILLKHWESYHPAMRHLLQVMHPKHPLSSTELQEFAGYQVLDLACRQSDLAKAFSIKLTLGLRDSKVDEVLKAIAHDNYFLFWKVKRGMDGYKAKIMEFAGEEMKLHALKSIGKTYLSIDLDSLEQLTDSNWTTLTKVYNVGWQLEGTKVVIRKPKPR
ncbi:hypothetical protein sscle_13g095530 [Sclerotinia sclerotiorum 1980 UF-70]|uniref:CSN8/PSMD8/EIF3K domain-containing protein n=1 Tax=Sclerotinia sclerotiorum (strain ATCC 18683 / 1980 / Ss-1) TaxID=665079 RepID=A0A1D9QJH6_SCLS1|nr:hypothetical protein sscle_13g095530 [Sclerotinia sclerotiorum 1980 UF-70]